MKKAYLKNADALCQLRRYDYRGLEKMTEKRNHAIGAWFRFFYRKSMIYAVIIDRYQNTSENETKTSLVLIIPLRLHGVSQLNQIC